MIDYIIEDCEQFSQKDKDEMFNLIAAHKKTGKEHGAKLCENGNFHKVIDSHL